jgi:hypothetical protein
MNPFRHVGSTPRIGGRPVARSLPTQDNKTQKTANMHPYFEWDSNPLPQCSSGKRPYAL